jgi:hypothetical protein
MVQFLGAAGAFQQQQGEKKLAQQQQDSIDRDVKIGPGLNGMFEVSCRVGRNFRW